MNRQDLIDQLQTELKTIADVGENVYTEWYMWDDAPNDQYPILIVQGGPADHNYKDKSTLDTWTTVIIYGYVMDYEHRETKLNSLIQSVDTIVHNDPTSNGLTLDRQLGRIETDQGLQKPYGLFIREVKLWTHENVSTR